MKSAMTKKKDSERLFKSLRLLVVGFGIGVMATLTVGMWNEVSAVYKAIFLVLLGCSLYFGWRLVVTFNKSDDANNAKDPPTNSPSDIMVFKSSNKSHNSTSDSQTQTDPLHNILLKR